MKATRAAIKGHSGARFRHLTNEGDSVKLNKGLESIGWQAFDGTAVNEIEIPPTVTHVGKCAFKDCENLRAVILDEGIKKISHCAFSESAIEKIETPSTLASIETGAFLDCKNLREVKLNGGLAEIGDFAFSGTAIEEIEIPNTVKSLGYGAFKDCENLSEIRLGGSLTKIEATAFEGCKKLSEVKIEEGIIEIDYWAFLGTPVRKVEIPFSVDRVDGDAFPNSWQSKCVLTHPDGTAFECEKDGSVIHDYAKEKKYFEAMKNDPELMEKAGLTEVQCDTGIKRSEDGLADKEAEKKFEAGGDLDKPEK